MLIILEGADGTGKTSLAYALLKRLDELSTDANDRFRLLHRGPPEDHPLVEYTHALEDYVPRRGEHVVCDRWHWGELVYGPLYRGESLLGEAGRAYVDAFLAARGAVVVHVDGGTYSITDRLLDRGEDYLKLEDLDHVLAAYRGLARGARPLHTVTVTPTSPGDPEVVKQVLTIGILAERNAPIYSRSLAGYVGPAWPTWLLVGDEPNGDPGERAPFPPYPGSSGRWLWEALPPAISSRVGVINSLYRGRLEPVRDVWEANGRPRTVALGRRAEARLQSLGVPATFVAHPQYWRRFRHAERDAFVKEIFDA